jgi:3',5'-cyclic AMP phosphodiesterase CpdA
MKLISEPEIAVKVRRMKGRVRWQHPTLVNLGIDQTHLHLEGQPIADDAFSFLVLGDSGTGRHRSSSPQRQVAEQLMAHGDDAAFILHTGDVVYLVGSSEQYRANFIKPYREWLVGGEDYRHMAYDNMTFRLPLLPVPGNHDYYDLPPLIGLLAGITGPLRYALRSYVDLDVGWHGSFKGDAYARAFLDYLKAIPEAQLPEHLARHYTGGIEGRRCLTYCPGQFTRLPNRYYSFRVAGIDFFALDSNTFNQPLPFPNTPAGQQQRVSLQHQRQQLAAQKADLLRRLGNPLEEPAAADSRDDLTEELEQLDEQLYDIDKQLATTTTTTVDLEQLHWLRDRLIASWQDPDSRGRILFLHHPPYVTEATKWSQGQTLAVRYHLRQVLDAVLAEVADRDRHAPLVNLVLCGHAHCLEYLQTGETGHGDAHIPWVICGGSGYSLRRQRPEGPDLMESIGSRDIHVATSRLFVGRTGQGSTLKRPYSGLRVNVLAGHPLRLRITPLIAEKFDGQWHPYQLDSFSV